MARIKSKRRNWTSRHRLSRTSAAAGNSPGGKSNRLLMQTLNQSHLDQLCQAVGSHQGGIESPELIKVQEYFAALKEQLNLPADAVEFQHHIVAGHGFREGRQHTEVAGQSQGDGRR